MTTLCDLETTHEPFLQCRINVEAVLATHCLWNLVTEMAFRDISIIRLSFELDMKQWLLRGIHFQDG